MKSLFDQYIHCLKTDNGPMAGANADHLFRLCRNHYGQAKFEVMLDRYFGRNQEEE